MASSGPEARKSSSRGVCVVLASQGAGHASAPRELMDAMHSRGMDPILCKNEFEAMALLVRRERDRRAGREPALTVVLVLGPSDCGSAAALFHSASRHAPHAAFWRYDGGTRRLEAFAPSAPERPSAFGDLVVRRGAVRKASLRLAGEGEVPHAPGATDAPAPGRPRAAERPELSNPGGSPEVDDGGRARGASPAALTDEELNMLLADDR